MYFRLLFYISVLCKVNYFPSIASSKIIWKTISNKGLNMKPGSIYEFGFSFAMKIWKFRLFNYNAYKKYILNYVLGLIVLKRQKLILFA